MIFREGSNWKDDRWLDLVARWVIMASFLYYGLNESIVDDSQFDKWCKHLAKKWDKLDRYRQWQLGSPEEIRTSGYHVKVTAAQTGGALAWLDQKGMKKNLLVHYNEEPKWSKRYQVNYWTPEQFCYGSAPKPKRKRVKLGRVRL